MKNNKIIIASTIAAVIILAGGIWYLNTTDIFDDADKTRSIAVGVTSQPASEVVRNDSTIRVVYAPKEVKKDKAFSLAWGLNAVGDVTETTHTAVYYDTVSRAGTLNTDATPEQAGYASFTKDFIGKNHPVPQTFTIDFTAEQTGELFFRALAVIDGKNYWTDEYKIVVKE